MRWQVATLALLLAVVSAELFVVAQQAQSPDSIDTNVTAEDLLSRPASSNWTSYNGDYTGQRYSSLREIDTANVARLRAAWVFHPGNSQRLEATPVVVRGMMYVTSANDVFALDARMGRTVCSTMRLRIKIAVWRFGGIPFM
jgi:alcohol dehydrogenase (cytochrome c)